MGLLGIFSQLRRKRREHLIEDLKMRKERKQELENRTSQSSLDEYRPLKSRGMALRYNVTCYLLAKNGHRF